MVFRRHKSLWQVLILLIVVGTTLRFSYNYYTENALKLKAANIRHHELLEERNKISRELDGRYCMCAAVKLYKDQFVLLDVC